jgi:Domain of unknown function (DUF3576)
MKKVIILLLSVFMLASCGDDAELSTDFPLNPERERNIRRGTMTGDGLALYGRRSEVMEEREENGGVLGMLGGSGKASNPLGVNSFLWRATLDTVSFMPLTSADPFGGVVITDWYEDTQAQGERFKMNILILDKQLRADGLKVTVFRQVKDETGQWRDVEASSQTARTIEDAILTRARQLKIHHSQG